MTVKDVLERLYVVNSSVAYVLAAMDSREDSDDFPTESGDLANILNVIEDVQVPPSGVGLMRDACTAIIYSELPDEHFLTAPGEQDDIFNEAFYEGLEEEGDSSDESSGSEE